MFKYVPTIMPQRVLVVGCGGTGSRLVPLLCQFLKTVPWVLSPEVVLIDNDIVEPKNLLRQNFISIDVDKPKAVVLAQRYSKAYDINIIPMVQKVEPVESSSGNKQIKELLRKWNSDRTPTILVMCVDSAEARRDIMSVYLRYCTDFPTVIIDTGNENDFGQVKICGNTRYESNSETFKKMGRISDRNFPYDISLNSNIGLPLDISYFDTMVSSDAPSCADLDQTMAINSMVANVVLSVIQNWYYAKPIVAHRYGISLSHGVTPEYLDLNYIQNMMYETNRWRQNLGSFSPFTANIHQYTRTYDVVAETATLLRLYTQFNESMKQIAEEERLAKEKQEALAKEAETKKKKTLLKKTLEKTNESRKQETPPEVLAA